MKWNFSLDEIKFHLKQQLWINVVLVIVDYIRLQPYVLAYMGKMSWKIMCDNFNLIFYSPSLFALLFHLLRQSFSHSLTQRQLHCRQNSLQRTREWIFEMHFSMGKGKIYSLYILSFHSIISSSSSLQSQLIFIHCRDWCCCCHYHNVKFNSLK